MQWYVMNLRYLRVQSLTPALQSAGMEFFIPPKITNLVFLHSTQDIIDLFLASSPLGGKVSFMRSRQDYKPIVVRDADMDVFISICKYCEMPILMTEKPVITLGDHVRVKDGPLRGTEGYVVRMRKSKRVLVEVAGIIWAATSYIPPEMLEVLD